MAENRTDLDDIETKFVAHDWIGVGNEWICLENERREQLLKIKGSRSLFHTFYKTYTALNATYNAFRATLQLFTFKKNL